MKQELALDRGTNKLHISHLPFSAVPHQSPLFIEYQRDPVSLRQFYPNAAGSIGRISNFAPDVLSNYRIDRRALCDALFEINTRIAAGPKTFANIELLRQNNTVAVVTGQQAGLFTGPLYTVYKALSAIRMAEFLNRNGTPAVPVFWIAGEDHDFDEVAETYFIGRDGDNIKSTYRPEGYIKDQPVGTIAIDNSILKVIDQTIGRLQQTEFSDDVRTRLATSWAEGTTFGDAFARSLSLVLEKFGLIFVDPLNDGLKRLASPLYVQAVKEADKLVTALVDRSGKLEQLGYHSQVLVGHDYFPLFWHDDEGRRRALRRASEGTYIVKGDKREFTTRQLADIAADEPRRFSPGVMLRPVVQDFLFPTICYFGGGAEIAYFAQNSEVYRVLERPVTPIIHRQSFTVIEAKYKKVLEKLDIDLSGLFDGPEATALRAAERTIVPDTANLFADVVERINVEIDRLAPTIAEVDGTLSASLLKRRSKIDYHIESLRKKTLLAQVRKDDTLKRQLQNIFNALLPNGELQERSLNVFSYLNRFGPNFIDWIYEAIDLKDKDHRIIEL